MSMNRDVWSTLAESRKPLVLYGTGDGADKILNVMEERGITAAGVFASDGFVRQRQFRGMPVLSYAEAKEQFGDMLVVVAFASSRPEVIANMARLNRLHQLVAPDVPVAGGALFDGAFYAAHREDFARVRTYFADEESCRLYDCVLEYKLTGSIDGLLAAFTPPETIWREVLRPECYESYCDLGAYNGDTLREILGYQPGLRHILAMEPDARSFRKLSAWSQDNRPDAELYNAAAWSEKTTLEFAAHGSRSSGTGAVGKTIPVEALALDDLLSGRKTDYIKYDVEGAEAQAILGSAGTIRQWQPDLCVSLYHKSEDLFVLPDLVRSLCPGYRMTLRRWEGIPAWDLNLYCTMEEMQ